MVGICIFVPFLIGMLAILYGLGRVLGWLLTLLLEFWDVR